MAVTWLASTDKSDPSHWGQAYGLYHAAESASGREVILPAATIRAIFCVIVMRGCTSQSALSGSPRTIHAYICGAKLCRKCILTYS